MIFIRVFTRKYSVPMSSFMIHASTFCGVGIHTHTAEEKMQEKDEEQHFLSNIAGTWIIDAAQCKFRHLYPTMVYCMIRPPMRRIRCPAIGLAVERSNQCQLGLTHVDSARSLSIDNLVRRVHV